MIGRINLARWILLTAIAIWPSLTCGADTGPFMATGFKVGEVTDASAIVWARLTLRAQRNPSDGPVVTIEYGEPVEQGGRRDRPVKAVLFPNGATVGDLKQGAPGTDGEVRVSLRTAGDADWQTGDWQSVDPLGDFTRQVPFTGLHPATRYEVKVESRSVAGEPGATLLGEFRTAPKSDDPRKITFTVATCFGNDDQDSPEGFKIYRSMARLKPDFFVNTGDIVYYDELAKTADLARYHWQRTYSWSATVDFHRLVPSYFLKDDHDTWRNDCWPEMQSPYMHEFTFRQGQAIFRQQVPMGASTYRTVRWGKDVQLWFVEGRDFRTPNDGPDGPEKTIWGAEQKQWFKTTFAASDATFRILVSPTPLAGPDRAAKRDNHANSGFQHEGRELRSFLQGQPNSLVICGDRHWQYMSVDPKTKLREYSSGPASDEHAGGWEAEDYREGFHRFLRVKGGFLSVTAERQGDVPTLTVRFHDVDGGVKFEDRLSAVNR